MEKQDQEQNKTKEFPTLKLPILPLTHSPDHKSGTATPPLQDSASVPFKWEEQPGKPRPCTDIIPLPDPNKLMELQLPPCRILSMDHRINIPKIPSPTTVLDGPCEVGRSKFSSFRFFKEAQQDSFDSSSSSCGVWSPERKKVSSKGYFGSFRFSSNSNGNVRCENEVKKSCMPSNGSFSSHAKSSSTHILATIYEGLKQVIPWKTAKKPKKEVHVFTTRN